MKRFLIFGLLAVGQMAAANCLKPIQIKSYELDCKVSGDCALTGDACRSCQPVAVNKKYSTVVSDRDLAERRRDQCILACEGCSTERTKIVCKSGRCSVTMSD